MQKSINFIYIFNISFSSCHSRTLSQKTGTSVHSLRSININVIPTFGHIVNVNEADRQAKVFLTTFRSEKSINGVPKMEHFMPSLETLTQLVTLPSLWRKWLRNQSLKNTSTITLRGLDWAEDSDFDSPCLIILLNSNYYLLTLLTVFPLFYL